MKYDLQDYIYYLHKKYEINANNLEVECFQCIFMNININRIIEIEREIRNEARWK
jgi:hypothetical protein